MDLKEAESRINLKACAALVGKDNLSCHWKLQHICQSCGGVLGRDLWGHFMQGPAVTWANGFDTCVE